MHKQHPGSQLMFFGYPYGLEEHLRRVRLGIKSSMLRTERCVHPRALRAGDVLATGERVLESSREAEPGVSVFIHITDGKGDSWYKVSDRLPLALLDEESFVSQVLLQTLEVAHK